MKKNQYFLSTVLALVVFLACVIALLVRVWFPAAVIPPLNIPNMVLLCVIALLVEHYHAPYNLRCYICIPVFGALIFGILPLMAGFACQHDFWKYGLVGCVVFTITTYLFTYITDRLLTGPKTKVVLLACGLGMYLAAQGFAGMIL